MEPLRGVRVLDFTRVLSGPYATMILGDLGADVVKVESPDGGDETRSVVRFEGRDDHDEDYFYVANRNKRSITLDLKHDKGRQIAHELADEADIVVENFSVGVMERLGLGSDVLVDSNPGLIYCSISGFGPDGPSKDLKAYDSIIQALSGLMSITGEPSRPPARAGIMVGDLAGSLYAVIAIQAALRQREETGVGAVLDIPMHDALVALLTVNAAEYLANGRVPQPTGSSNPNRSPAGSFRTEDGRYIQIFAATSRLWESFCKTLQFEHLIDDIRFSSNQQRLKNRDELTALVEERLSQHPAKIWIEKLGRAGVPCGLVQTIDEALVSEHSRFAKLVRTIEHPRSGSIRQIASPIRVRGEDDRQQTMNPPPLLGQDTADVLEDWLGMTSNATEDLAGLRAFG